MMYEQSRGEEGAPLLLRRAQPRPVVPAETTANMTVVTTQSAIPEMHDQVDDPTAPRND